MSVLIFDIAKGIYLTEARNIFFTPNKPEDSIIIEYLNDVSLTDIETEIDKLEKFNSLSGISEKINYIAQNSFYYFSNINDENLAKIAGFDDFSIMVLFDINTDSIFLRHVYGK